MKLINTTTCYILDFKLLQGISGKQRNEVRRTDARLTDEVPQVASS
jgi:hypothetical protein